MKNQSIIFFVLLFLISLNLNAQGPGDLPSDEIEVLKNFEARLAEANRLRVNPELPKNSKGNAQVFNYSISPSLLDTEYEPPKIRPLALRRKKVNPGYKAYLEGGYGFPNSPYLLGAYETYSDNWGIGLGVSHYSANDKEANHLTMSETKGDVRGSYLINDQIYLTAGLNLGFHKRYFNTSILDTVAHTDTIAFRKINEFAISAGIENAKDTELGIDYKLNMEFQRAKDDIETQQNLFSTSLSFVKHLNNKNPVGLDIGNYLSTYKPIDGENQDVNAFYANPYFKFGFDKIGFLIGADIIAQNNNPKIYPDLDILFNIKNNELLVFIETEAYYVPFDFIQNIESNPYMISNFEAGFQEIFEVIGGVKGIVQNVNYTIKGGYQNINQLPLYINDPINPNRFDVIYDTAQVILAGLDLEYKVQEDLLLFSSVEKKFFDLSNSSEAFHTPSLRINLGGKYWMMDKRLLIGLNVFVENGLYYQDVTDNNEVKKMDALLDMSFNTKYMIGEHFGMFLRLNNLTNNTRERLRYYPSFGFNGLGGIILRF